VVSTSKRKGGEFWPGRRLTGSSPTLLWGERVLTSTRGEIDSNLPCARTKEGGGGNIHCRIISFGLFDQGWTFGDNVNSEISKRGTIRKLMRGK